MQSIGKPDCPAKATKPSAHRLHRAIPISAPVLCANYSLLMSSRRRTIWRCWQEKADPCFLVSDKPGYDSTHLTADEAGKDGKCQMDSEPIYSQWASKVCKPMVGDRR
jgi:hypothetical protein